MLQETLVDGMELNALTNLVLLHLQLQIMMTIPNVEHISTINVPLLKLDKDVLKYQLLVK